MKSKAGAPNGTGSGLEGSLDSVGRFVMSRTLLRPSISDSQSSWLVDPEGLTIPIPVMTTRFDSELISATFKLLNEVPAHLPSICRKSIQHNAD